MRRTKEWWARLTKEERARFRTLEGARIGNQFFDYGLCPTCPRGIVKKALCPSCLDELAALIRKASGEER